MNMDEKPWILSYYKKEHQLDEDEHTAFLRGVENKDEYVALKDGRVLSTRFESLEPNPHYVSPEEVEKGRKVRALRWEFEDLKKQGVVTTLDEYKEWKKKSVAQNKKLEEYLYDGAEPENEPIF